MAILHLQKHVIAVGDGRIVQGVTGITGEANDVPQVACVWGRVVVGRRRVAVVTDQLIRQIDIEIVGGLPAKLQPATEDVIATDFRAISLSTGTRQREADTEVGDRTVGRAVLVPAIGLHV